MHPNVSIEWRTLTETRAFWFPSGSLNSFYCCSWTFEGILIRITRHPLQRTAAVVWIYSSYNRFHWRPKVMAKNMPNIHKNFSSHSCNTIYFFAIDLLYMFTMFQTLVVVVVLLFPPVPLPDTVLNSLGVCGFSSYCICILTLPILSCHTFRIPACHVWY